MSAEQYDSVLVVSDAHVGLGRDEVFKDEFEAFIRHLASREILEIETEKGRLHVEVPKAIVLLGDFVDLWDGRLSELPEFTARFGRLLADKADVFHLRGNHDYVVPNIQPELAAADVKKIEICEHKLLEVGGESWFFIHGHQFMSAFGPVSLKLESYINPYYSLMEDFFSRLFPQDDGRGRQVVYSLTALFLLVCAVLASGQPVVAEPTNGLVVWVVFGMLLPLAIVSVWRLLQKTAWKLFVMIFGELIDSLRGAVKGDNIKYLTSPSRPISRWFAKGGADSKRAREAGHVCFGHTHIPEGPINPEGELSSIQFLNPGSWARPPSTTLVHWANRLRESKQQRLRWDEKQQEYMTIMRYYDRIDEYLVILFLALVVLSQVWLRISLTFLLLSGVTLLIAEVLVVFSKSSYRRLPLDKPRSLAFIGKDGNGVPRQIVLSWDPNREILTQIPQDPNK